MNLKLAVIIERSQGPSSKYFIASIPAIPGAISQGKTMRSAISNALDALKELAISRETSNKQELDGLGINYQMVNINADIEMIL